MPSPKPVSFLDRLCNQCLEDEFILQADGKKYNITDDELSSFKSKSGLVSCFIDGDPKKPCLVRFEHVEANKDLLTNAIKFVCSQSINSFKDYGIPYDMFSGHTVRGTFKTIPVRFYVLKMSGPPLAYYIEHVFSRHNKESFGALTISLNLLKVIRHLHVDNKAHLNLNPLAVRICKSSKEVTLGDVGLWAAEKEVIWKEKSFLDSSYCSHKLLSLQKYCFDFMADYESWFLITIRALTGIPLPWIQNKKITRPFSTVQSEKQKFLENPKMFSDFIRHLSSTAKTSLEDVRQKIVMGNYKKAKDCNDDLLKIMKPLQVLITDKEKERANRFTRLQAEGEKAAQLGQERGSPTNGSISHTQSISKNDTDDAPTVYIKRGK